ncbi:ATP-dependent nuclease [Paraburkholderia lacunae]|uniref:AAA family ATPase n=1 Tax=Paraburkholderia lacunae TaxID=2211104 RepID=A0A370MWS4_9BURK|nr:AAA family ATPase [Paraburkholderia lacunae]RDJ97843.1 AAA family ATPase [Paraburkholderia lacunae]
MSIANIIDNARFTILLGKNGSGKSTKLRAFKTNQPNVKYVSPERGGTLKYDPNVETNISNIPTWIDDTRRRNRLEMFREQSAVQFRALELLVLREIERDKREDKTYNFDVILDKINNLLPKISFVRTDRGFSISSKSGDLIPEDQISSGEAETIALAIEVLVFSRLSVKDKILLLDEPDVHLHPDLQHRFVAFLESEAQEKDMRVVIATHSTAVIGAFSPDADLQILPITGREQTEFNCFKRSAVCEEVLPIFGAHPLSSMFNKSPIVLVEGEDDKRVLEQVIRSGKGKFIYSPCVVGSVTELAEWEKWLDKIMPAIYDEPVAYSLRDLDDSSQTEIDDVGIICRVRLNCYAIENLLLTDQCIQEHGFSADSFKGELEKWLSQASGHKYADQLKDLLGKYDERRTVKIKDLRNIIVALLTNKPWEVVVGQLIAKHAGKTEQGPHSICNYLGAKALNTIFS